MNAAIYCRISTDRDGRGLGVARQESDCRTLCANRGWDVSAVYVDNDISASGGKRRPQYEQMLADLKAGTVQAVVAYHNDRLHRSPRELEDFIDIIEAAGAEVATVAGGAYDLGTATGRMGARIVGAVARAESERLKERIRRKHLELAQAGENSGGGTRPFGFNEDRVTVREDEAGLIRDAAARILAGGSVRGVCADWTARGIPTVSGTAWSPYTLRRMLMSARVAGKREHRGVVTDAVWLPILDEITWHRVRAILSDPARRLNGNPRWYLLTGLVECGLCSAKMVARPTDAKQRRYVCARGPGFRGCGKIQRMAEPVEALVVAQLFDRVDSGLVAAAAPSDEALNRAVARVAELEHRLAELAEDYYGEQALSRPQFFAASQRLSGLLADAQRAVGALSRASVPVPPNLRTSWDDLAFDVQRAVVTGLVERVIIEPAVKGLNQFDPTRVHTEWRDIA